MPAITERQKTGIAFALFVIAFWLWISDFSMLPTAAERPTPQAENVRRPDFTPAETLKKASGL